MTGHIDRDQPMRHKLAQDRAPAIGIMLRADAERGEPIVAPFRDALGFFAKQHVDDMRLAETLARAVNAGEKFLRGNCAVERLGRLKAGIAIAAWRAVIGEIAQ